MLFKKKEKEEEKQNIKKSQHFWITEYIGI